MGYDEGCCNGRASKRVERRSGSCAVQEVYLLSAPLVLCWGCKELRIEIWIVHITLKRRRHDGTKSSIFKEPHAHALPNNPSYAPQIIYIQYIHALPNQDIPNMIP